MSKNILLNITNHPSERWSNEQKEGWDRIIDIPFPSVPPHLDTNDRTYQNILTSVTEKIVEAIREHRDSEIYICLQGEFSLCYRVFEICKAAKYPVLFVVPTTERVVEEITLDDGTTKKNIIFKFVKWRLI